METNGEKGKEGVCQHAGHSALLLRHAGVLFVYFTNRAPGRSRRRDTFTKGDEYISKPSKFQTRTNPVLWSSDCLPHPGIYNLIICFIVVALLTPSCPVESGDWCVPLWLWFKGFWAAKVLTSSEPQEPQIHSWIEILLVNRHKSCSFTYIR